MTRDRTIRLLAFLCGAYPSLKVTDDMIETWALMLEHDDADGIQAAAARYIRSGRPYPPLLSDLCSGAAEAAVGLPDAEAAWTEVGKWRSVAREAIRTNGSYTLPPWSSPLTAGIIESLGGWAVMCDDDDAPGVMRGHFLRLYASARAGTERASNLHAGGLALPRPIAHLLPSVLDGSPVSPQADPLAHGLAALAALRALPK